MAHFLRRREVFFQVLPGGHEIVEVGRGAYPKLPSLYARYLTYCIYFLTPEPGLVGSTSGMKHDRILPDTPCKLQSQP